VEHSDDFNAILKSLQSTYGPKDEAPPTTTLDDIFGPAPTGFGFKAEEPPKKVKKHEELEAKSKSSRSRIHYHKFTKNKDLSKIGEKDWSCIFGKPIDDDGGNPIVKPEPELVAPNREEMDDEEETSAHNVYGSAKYINRGSLTDYFKSQRDKAFQKSTLPEDEKQEEIELPVEKVEIETIAEDAEDESSSRKHKKKSKKSKKRNQEEIEAEEEESRSDSPERKKSKKDKKKKRKELEESTTQPEEEDGPNRLKEQQDNLNGRKTPKRNQITASERQEAALTFKGSNILTIPGYRNQSNKL